MNTEHIYERMTGEQVTLVFTKAANQLAIYMSWEEGTTFTVLALDRAARTLIVSDERQITVWILPLDHIAAVLWDPHEPLNSSP